MARFFQIPNFRRDDYQRPDQKWTCGRACDGKGCQFGPDGKGQCHTTGECKPARQGDRWVCTRPDPHGGPCERGPLPTGECCRQIGPCQPVLSLRARRGRWVWAAAGLTLGLLLVFGGTGREAWADPGPLSSAHALSNARCSDCHVAAEGTQGIFGGPLSGGRRPASASCLNCHDLGAQPLNPHGLERAAIEHLRLDVRPGTMGASHSVVLAIARLSGNSDASRDCILCHTEHHGRHASPTAFNNLQCQVCHAGSFDSFSKGHPEFGAYPFVRRTHLVFDHAKHLGEHFADKSVAAFAPKDCQACHTASTGGGFMLVRSFEQTCAACHGTQIEGEGRAGDKGIAFFRVPGLDAPTLEGRGHPVGQWPSDADGPVTPFMRLLLAKDKGATQALRTLAGVDLTDLRGASDERVAAAETLAWSIKSLFADLVTSGQDAMISRLGEIDPGADRAQLRAMTAQLPRDGLLSAQAAWFPSLFSEVANFRAGIRLASEAPASPAPAAPAAARPAASAGQEDLLDDKPAPPVAVKAKPAGDDLLGDDLSSDSKPVSKPAPKAAPKHAAPARKPAADDDLGDDLASTPAPVAAPGTQHAPKGVPPLTVTDAEAWSPAGGWYRSSDNPTLFYRPVGHADAFLTIWLTSSARLSSGENAGLARPLFAALSDTKAPGLCMKCHSVEGGPGGQRLVNWVPDMPVPARHEITTFNHAAHFSLMDQKGCQTCHQMKAQSAYLASFADNLDPAHFESNFAPISKATCAACHNDKIAGESCQLCHTYHVGDIKAKIASTGQMKPLD